MAVEMNSTLQLLELKSVAVRLKLMVSMIQL
jgi:hypothetical protein